jgi:hypothetical protein
MVEENSMPEPNSGCWLWLGAVDKDGYALRGGKRVARELWKSRNGPVAAGMVVRHKCDVAGCVNLDHLLVGTQKQNIGDMFERRRQHSNAGEKHGMAKLTPDQVRSIRAEVSAGGRSYAKIAANYGVTSWNIYSIANHRSWKHLR